MRFLLVLIIVSAVWPAGFDSRPAAGEKSEPPESIFQSYRFPGHPNLTHLCGERVYGTSGEEINWDAFASPARPSKLVAYYRRKLGDAGFTGEGEGGTWRLPADAPRPAADARRYVLAPSSNLTV